ncbi:MAG: SDR family oxidoreductase [Gammaproteobacteria bacterium]|nr:SDR family oxidoreductase [Rhizobiaceae bacterium]MBU4115514.1 SDR family oxidoreductase [Gammaproteobacteria bacterium]
MTAPTETLAPAPRYLEGKTCLIVGVASLRGIGYATAELFARHGGKLVVVDLTMTDAVAAAVTEQITARIGSTPELIGMPCDIQSLEACRSVVDAAVARFGTIDCLVNTAAIVKSDGFLSISGADLDLILNVNLKGAFNVCQSVLPVFERAGKGTIVNIASVAAQRGGGLVGGAHYAASKGGVISLTRSIAREFGAKGIRANVICPSMTETGMLDGNVTAAQFAQIVEGIPLKRAGRAEDIANACLFLASELAAYITGTTLDVNGGSHIH